MAQQQDDQIRQSASECKAAFDACAANPVLKEDAWIRSAQGDFNLWCSAIKATNRGKSSIDHRLSKHPDLCEAVCDLLAGLTTSVERYEEIISSPSPVTGDINLENPSSRSSDDTMSDRSSCPTSLSQSTTSNPILAEYVSYIRTILDELTRISLAVRRAGAKYRVGKAYSELDEKLYEDFRKHLTTIILASTLKDADAKGLSTEEKMDRVREEGKLNKVQLDLVKVNILRRNRFEDYTQKSASKSQPKVEKPQVEQPRGPDTNQATMIATPSTISSSAKHSPAATPVRLQAQQESRLDARSTTSTDAKTATAIDSQMESKDIWRGKGSSRVTKVTKIAASQAYPRCPKPPPNEPLICPYCNERLPSAYSEDELSWKAHVAQDIVPYSCIIDGCDTPHEMYLTGDKLLYHMIEKHSSQTWTCDYCSYGSKPSKQPNDPTPQDFTSAEEWESHMEDAHCDIVPAAQRPVLAELSKRQMIGPLSCPLCEFTVGSMAASVDDHILKHLHEFSLRGLPEDTGGLVEKGSTALQGSSSATVLSYTKEEWTTDIALDYLSLDQVKMREIGRYLESFAATHFNKHFNLCVQLEQTILLLPDLTQPASELWGSLFWILIGARATCLEYTEARECFPNEGKMQKTLLTEEMVDDIILQDVNRLLGATANSLPYLGVKIQSDIPLYGNLRPANCDLVGREEILEELESLLFLRANRFRTMHRLSGDETAAVRFKHAIEQIDGLNRQTNIILGGDSGIGKTEIALNLANEMRRQSEDWTILWVHAQSEESVRASYAQILRHLGLRIPAFGDEAADMEIRTLLYHLTWTYTEPWMMILDGLDAPGALYLRLANMLPRAGRGIFLFTTAYPQLAKLFGPAELIEVPPLDNIAALALFISTRGKPLSSEELRLAKEISGGVKGLPLRVIEAASQPLQTGEVGTASLHNRGSQALEDDRFTESEDEATEEASEVLVIAIDYGTRFTSVAYGHRNGLRRPTYRDIQCIDDWPGTSRNSSNQKVPSEVAYSENGFDWGNKIQPRNRHREAWTKLLLDETQKEKQLVLMQELDIKQNGANGGRSKNNVSKEPVDIVSDFLTGVRKHVETTLKIRFANKLQALRREVVITVPAVWSDKAKNLTYKAVCNAGFNTENTRIFMITESEAVAIFALRALEDGPFTNIKPGDHFVVCDAGDVTIDIITYRVESTKDAFVIREAVVGTGDKCGAIFIDREFKSWLRQKLGQAKFGMIRNEWLKPESRMMRTFEEARMSFEDDNIMAFVTMPPEISREDDEALDIEDGEMRLDPEDMREIFDPCINRVLTLIDSQINEVSSQTTSVKYIIVAGEFGKSTYLLKRIRERFSGQNIEVIRPSNSWTAVVRGAVMEKLYPVGKSLVQLRLCRRHYGASLTQPFAESTHGNLPGENLIMDKSTGVRFVKGCMTWILSKGDPLQSSKARTTEIMIPQTFTAGFNKSFEVKILAWNESDPPSREAKGLEQVCVLSIDFTDFPPESLQTLKISDSKFIKMMVCKVEIKIKGSMLEFLVRVGNRECCRALARDA